MLIAFELSLTMPWNSFEPCRWDKFEQICNMAMAGTIAGQPKRKALAKTAQKQAEDYAKVAGMGQGPWMAFPSLDIVVQHRILDVMVLGKTTFPQMKAIVEGEKQIIETKKAFVAISELKDWDEVVSTIHPDFTKIENLRTYSRDVAFAMKRKRKSADDAGVEVAEPTVMPAHFREMVRRAVTYTAERKAAGAVTGLTDNNWMKFSVEDQVAMYGQVRFFDGKAMSNKLPDGTAVSDGMRYKCVLGDSTSQDWKEVQRINHESQLAMKEKARKVAENFERSVHAGKSSMWEMPEAEALKLFFCR